MSRNKKRTKAAPAPDYWGGEGWPVAMALRLAYIGPPITGLPPAADLAEAWEVLRDFFTSYKDATAADALTELRLKHIEIFAADASKHRKLAALDLVKQSILGLYRTERAEDEDELEALRKAEAKAVPPIPEKHQTFKKRKGALALSDFGKAMQGKQG